MGESGGRIAVIVHDINLFGAASAGGVGDSRGGNSSRSAGCEFVDYLISPPVSDGADLVRVALYDLPERHGPLLHVENPQFGCQDSSYEVHCARSHETDFEGEPFPGIVVHILRPDGRLRRIEALSGHGEITGELQIVPEDLIERL